MILFKTVGIRKTRSNLEAVKMFDAKTSFKNHFMKFYYITWKVYNMTKKGFLF